MTPTAFLRKLAVRVPRGTRGLEQCGKARKGAANWSNDPETRKCAARFYQQYGIGFDPAVLSDGLGLISMHERLRMLGGQLVVKSEPGKGTEIGAAVPLREAA